MRFATRSGTRGTSTTSRTTSARNRTLRLEDAIRKMTSMPAAHFGLWDRGLLRPGYAADVVVLDYERLDEVSTRRRPAPLRDGRRARPCQRRRGRRRPASTRERGRGGTCSGRDRPPLRPLRRPDGRDVGGDAPGRARLAELRRGRDAQPSRASAARRCSASRRRSWCRRAGWRTSPPCSTFCEPGDRVVLETSAHVLSTESHGDLGARAARAVTVAAAERAARPGRGRAGVRGAPAPRCSASRTRTRAPAARSPTSRGRRRSPRRRAARRPRAPRRRAARECRGRARRPARGARRARSTRSRCSLNKGLCAPFGALLAGERDDRRRRATSCTGSAAARCTSAGIAAAAGSSRSTIVDRLADDHRRARELAAGFRHPRPCAPERPGRDEHRPRGRHGDGSACGDAGRAARRGGRARDGADRARCGSSRTG